MLPSTVNKSPFEPLLLSSDSSWGFYLMFSIKLSLLSNATCQFFSARGTVPLRVIPVHNPLTVPGQPAVSLLIDMTPTAQIVVTHFSPYTPQRLP